MGIRGESSVRQPPRPSRTSASHGSRTRRPAITNCISHCRTASLQIALAVALLMVAGTGERNSALGDDAAAGFISRTHGNRRYVVFVPSAPPPPEGYPLILFLHSAGERGTDGQRQLDLGLGPAIRSRAETFPGLVVFPQADYADGPILETWRAGEPQGKLARAILADVEAHWPVDPARRAITGWSMGAYGALSHAAADPEYFSRVLAIAGGGEPQWGPPLANLPVWLVHGGDDRAVPPRESQTLFSHIPQPRARQFFTEVPSARHDVAIRVYDLQAVLDWLLSAEEAAPPVDAVASLRPQESDDRDKIPADFHPDLIISRAISLRLGNQALQTLAGGVPEALQDEALRGSLPPVEDRVEFDGQTYDIRFREMAYRGRLHRTLLEGQDSGRMRVAFALRDLEIRIGSIEVTGGTEGITASDVLIVLGHREPIWMNLLVTPLPTSGGLLELELHSADFEIGDHNWYVDPPQQIQIRGDQFTEEMVTTAIVGGLYQRKSLIEETIVGAVEPMLQQVEERVDFTPLAQLVTTLWPLPVYQPRLRVCLEDVSIDGNGVSLVFGCEVDDPAQSKRRLPSPVTASIPPAAQIEPVGRLRAAVAVDVVEHISELLAGTEMMAIYGADVPGRPFVELDDAAGLSQSLLELEGSASLADVRSRLALNHAFHYTPLNNHSDDTSPGGMSSVEMSIDVPELSLTLFAKEDASGARWDEVAHRELMLRQPIRLKVLPQLDGPTELVLAWGEQATISLAGEQAGAADPDELVTRCRKGWNRWVTLQQVSTSVPDVAVGTSALRLDAFCWQGECLSAEFQPAATVLINRSERPVEYCIRSEHSAWSPPLRLEPATRHIFRSGMPLQAREAARWSRHGEPLPPGIYTWSPQADAEGRHWIARESGRTSDRAASTPAATP